MFFFELVVDFWCSNGVVVIYEWEEFILVLLLESIFGIVMMFVGVVVWKELIGMLSVVGSIVVVGGM